MTFHRTRCAHCKGKLTPERPSQIVHVKCVTAWAEAQAAKREREEAKKARAAAKVERAETRRRKEAIKTIPQLIREAQVAFNAWVRARDAEQPCISCQKPPGDMTELHAGRDAGHYRSTGSAPHLRFHPDNCHAQCVKCNQWKAGNAVDYRLGLLARIGLQRLATLEANNNVHKWTREELTGIRDHYRAELKKLKEQS